MKTSISPFVLYRSCVSGVAKEWAELCEAIRAADMRKLGEFGLGVSELSE